MISTSPPSSAEPVLPGRSSVDMVRLRLPGGVEAAWTGRAEGDLGIHSAPGVDERRRAVVDRPWSWLRQVHGHDAVAVQTDAVEGEEADALVAPASHGGALAIFTADCGPVALASPEGPFAAVHAGWSGARAGVLPVAVEYLRRAGAREVVAVIGPCIHPECYEFSAADLRDMTDRFGPGVQARTADNRPALDLPAVIRSSLADCGVHSVLELPICTSCSPGHWSHRARRDPQRQALVMWRP